MTSSLVDLLKLSKNRNSTFTKFSGIFFGKRLMHKHNRVKPRTGTWGLVPEAIRLSGNCPYDLTQIHFNEKHLYSFGNFFRPNCSKLNS